ncbi:MULTISPECIES: hypothetical protein [unclassified Sphingomonas]|uniref:hypothetical protein n=1 Tax=unclassified Sphingomonas TaxID=196159 RepID=UPI0012E142C4|nr:MULTISPECIES: hypothetical protein [unclassified Sphingomonas]
MAIAAICSYVIMSGALSDSAYYQQQAHSNALRYKAYAEQQIRAECNSETGFKRIKCVEEIRHQQRAYYRDEYDLASQRQAALWGYTTAATAVIGLFLSILGVVLVWITFRATKEANDITRQSIRPWIDISVRLTPLWVEGTDLLGSFEIVLKNYGQTLAENVMVLEDCKHYRKDIPQPFDIEKFNWEWPIPMDFGSIPLGREIYTEGGFQISTDTEDSIYLVIVVKVTYDIGDCKTGEIIRAFNVRPTAKEVAGYEYLNASTADGTQLTAYEIYSVIR